MDEWEIDGIVRELEKEADRLEAEGSHRFEELTFRGADPQAFADALSLRGQADGVRLAVELIRQRTKAAWL